MAALGTAYRAALRSLLVRDLSQDDLRDVAFDLGLRDVSDALGKSELARLIIDTLDHRQALGTLVEWLRANRPDLGV